MPRLNQLRVYPSSDAADHATTYPDLHFRASTHHVAEMFMSMLAPGYTLDGAGLVTISCGPRGPSPEYSQVLGCTEVFAERFDFAVYQALDHGPRQEMILALIEDRLSDIAARVGADPAPIRECAGMVRKHGFVLEQEQHKLSRCLPGRRGWIRVYRRLGAGFCEMWLAKSFDPTGVVVHEALMREPAPLDLRQHFFRSQLRDEVFLVEDRFAKTVFSLPLPAVRA